jgi:DHA1 family inner membrane transport protein
MNPRIWLLTGAQFASATGAYAYTGLLADVARDLDVSLATAGQLAAAYALTFAVLGPISAALTARVDRRALLAIGLGFVAAFNLLSAFVPDFSSALMLRVAAAIAATLVLPGVAATMLVPPEQRGRAIATVLSGLTFAFALGIPLGTALGAAVGWRGTFLFSAALAGVAALGLLVGLPRLPSTDRGGALSLGIAFKPDILSVLGTSFLAFGGLFCIAAYIGPIVTATTGMTGSGIAAIQVFIGLGSLAGIALGGRMASRDGAAVPVRLVLLLAAALLGYAGLLALPPAAWHAGPLALCVFCGAVALFALAPISQARLVGLAPQDRAVALALMGAVTFAGQGAGAAMGGAAIGAFGLVATGIVGSATAILAALLARRAYAARPALTSA